MKELISVIVPVYNADKYVADCIESIIGQTYKELEIIVIDDGSKDESSKICDDYAKIDNRVRVYHNENKGVGATRNFGIEKATGTYLIFIDSDDICRPTMIETLVRSVSKMNEDATLPICGIGVFKNYPVIDRVLSKEDKVISVREYLQNILLSTKTGQFCGGPYNKLFSNKIIKTSGIRFRTDMNFAEDFCFNLEYLKLIKKIVLISDDLYLYREAAINSLTFKNYHEFNKEKYWKQRYDAYTAFENLFRHYLLYEKNDKIIHELLARFMISTIKMVCKFSTNKSDTINFIKSVCANDYCRRRIKRVKGLNISDKVRAFFISFKMVHWLYWLETTRYFIGARIKHMR